MLFNVIKWRWLKTSRDYTTISIPLSLADKIDEAVKKWGYQSRADFVRDAIRRLLESKEKEV